MLLLYDPFRWGSSKNIYFYIDFLWCVAKKTCKPLKDFRNLTKARWMWKIISVGDFYRYRFAIVLSQHASAHGLFPLIKIVCVLSCTREKGKWNWQSSLCLGFISHLLHGYLFGFILTGKVIFCCVCVKN